MEGHMLAEAEAEGSIGIVGVCTDDVGGKLDATIRMRLGTRYHSLSKAMTSLVHLHRFFDVFQFDLDLASELHLRDVKLDVDAVHVPADITPGVTFSLSDDFTAVTDFQGLRNVTNNLKYNLNFTGNYCLRLFIDLDLVASRCLPLN